MKGEGENRYTIIFMGAGLLLIKTSAVVNRQNYKSSKSPGRYGKENVSILDNLQLPIHTST